MRTNITLKLRVNLLPSIDGAPSPDRDAAPRRSLTPSSVHGYDSGMRFLRVSMLVLAVVQAPLAGLTAMVGAFADGGDIWSRLVVVLLHPLCAAGLLLLVLLPRLTRLRMLAIAALLLATVSRRPVACAGHRPRRGKGGLGASSGVLRDTRARSRLRPDPCESTKPVKSHLASRLPNGLVTLPERTSM